MPGFWRKCRVCFRWCRISLLLLILAAVCVLFWFNQVGLPHFLKDPLLARLKDHGILVEFTRMRLRMTRGIVAENVRVGAAGNSNSPTLAIREAQLLLDFASLLHGHLQVQGLVLGGGTLVVPVNEPAQPLATLTVSNIQAGLRFKANDTWALDNFEADFKNTKLTLAGDIVHASEVRNWFAPRGEKKPGQATDWQAQLRQFSATLAKIHLKGSPRLTLNVEGDARDLHSFDVRAQVAAPGVRTPWFSAQNLQFTANLTAPAGMPTNLDLPDFWSNAAPYRLAWSVHCTDLKSDRLNAGAVNARGSWHAPDLAVNELSMKLGGGVLGASLGFNPGTRQLAFRTTSAFDLHIIEPLLPEITRQRLALVSWTEPPALELNGTLDLSSLSQPPRVAVAGHAVLGAATVSGVTVDSVETHFSYSNLVWRLPDLLVVRDQTRLQMAAVEDETTKAFEARLQGRFDVNQIRPWLKGKGAAEVGALTFHQPLALDVTVRGQLHNLDTLAAEGHLALTNFSVRGGPVDSLVTAVTYSNRICVFPHPETWRMNGTQMMTADSVMLDFNQQRIYFKNGYSTTDPQFVADSIGPKTGRTLAPYQFLAPPTARVNGFVSLVASDNAPGPDENDLQVDVLKGAPFRWLHFNSSQLEGTIHWLGGTLDLSNLTGEFYGGRLDGSAHFDFRPKEGTDFSFAMNITNGNLHRLLVDLSSPTNRLEGLIGGRVVVTSGNSTNWQKMSGYGDASLKQGLIWDAPIFGFFSPALNKIDPGLGSSRATDAAATFVMTNGVIYSDNVEIHSTLMRIHYVGTVDLAENLNARATAALLRDTPGIGHLFSIVAWPVTKLFEYKVTGTLAEPKMSPLNYVSKLLLAPFHPIKSLEEILPAGNTNATAPPNNAGPPK